MCYFCVKIKNNMAGLYIHFPFCRNKCVYCGFYSEKRKINFAEDYCRSIIKELLSRKNEINEVISTVYLGGGTPSYIPAGVLKSLFISLKQIIAELWKPVEITVEINPDDVTIDNIEIWHSIGINRFSIGVQSFSDVELKRIGRLHSPQKAEDAIKLLHNYGDVSVDLICGLPQQTLESWNHSLSKIFSLYPQHLSIYMLSLDDGAALTHLVKQGKISLPDETEVIEMYRQFCKKANEHGYLHYEVSNFCCPGFKAIHNSSYWDGTPYLGLGCSASSYDGNRTRRTNLATLSEYLNGECKEEIEILNDVELQEEYIITRLRRMPEGINLNDYTQRFGQIATSKLISRAKQYADTGLLSIDSKISITGINGILLQDTIIRALTTD